LLPRWRGAAPIQRAILAGDEQTGVSIMRMEEGLDTGPYCVVRTTELDDKSATELTAELAALGADAIVEAVRLIDGGACAWIEQDDALATYADKIAKADVALTPELGVTQALRRVRASTPQAPARLCVGDRCASVTGARRAPDTLAPAAVACTKQALVLGFADGAILVERIRPDGRSEMPGCDWARGTRFDASTTWGATS
jgi:methionyl-tRNA formyltransferase